MFVDSYIELHTTLVGWALYDLVYELLAQTGLTLLPFLGLLVNALKEDIESDDPLQNSKIHMFRLIVAIIIFSFAVVPQWTIQPDTVRYQPPVTFSNSAPAAVTASDNTTTYSDNIPSTSIVSEAPLWWIFVQNVSAGLTHAISMSLPQEPDLESLKSTMQYLTVQDPQTRAEYKAFTQQCYLPAKNKHQSMSESNTLPPEAIAAHNRYGLDDLNFPGSRILQATPGLYADCNTSVGCLALKARHTVRDSTEPVVTCGDWWELLKNRLLQEDATELGTFQGLQARFGWSNEETEDVRLRNLMKNIVVNDLGTDNQYQDRSWFGNIVGLAQDVTSIAPLATSAFTKDTETRIFRKILPMLKAFLLMFLTMFLPLMLLFARYQPSMVLLFTVMFFGVQFMGAILNVSTWLETVFVRSIMDDVDLISYFANPVDVTQKRLILAQAVDYATYASLFIWSTVISMSGFVGYQGVARMTSSMEGGGRQTSGAGADQFTSKIQSGKQSADKWANNKMDKMKIR